MKENNEKKSKLTRTELVLSLVVTGLILYLLHSFINSPEIVQPECTNPACYESIIEINNFIDPTVDPCEDFHQFACGNFFETAFKKQVTLPIAQEQEELNNELDAMILEQILAKDPASIRLQKKFFQACIDEKSVDENISKKILELIDQIGGWPLIMAQNWKDKDFDWIDVMLKCRDLGLPFQWFLQFGIHLDDVNYLKISYPVLEQQKHQKLMESAINSVVKKKVYVNEIYEFERRLINILPKQKPETEMYTIAELQEKYPVFNWLQMLNDITKDSYELTEESLIATNTQKYIVELYQLLKGTPKRTQANYIVWKIVEKFLPFLTINTKNYDNKTEICRKLTRNSFPYVSEVNYIKKYSKEEIKGPAIEIAHLVREEFLNRIQKSTWWNTTAGQIYLKTFENTEIDIGLQLGAAEDDFLDSNYLNIGNLTLDSDNIIDIITERSYHYYNSIFSTINQTALNPEEKLLVQHVATMNIFFQSSLNKIIVPPSMLHGIIYHFQRPFYLNFATFGTLLAKEFIKSLQILTQSDKNVTNAAFEASDRCFQDDYLQMSQNDEVVQEVLPDVIARDIAFTAYQNWVTTNGDENGLPLLEYSPNQLFWIKSSLINCHKKLTEDFEVLVSKYKNVLAARHSRHFADVFGCLGNTPMNPTEKC